MWDCSLKAWQQPVAVSRSHLVSRRKVRYLSNSNVNHHHHVRAVEDVSGLPAGENILQKLEHRVRCRRRVFEYTHRVVWKAEGAERERTSEDGRHGCKMGNVTIGGIFTASVKKQQHFLWQDLEILLLQLLHYHIAAGCWTTWRRKEKQIWRPLKQCITQSTQSCSAD